MWKHTQNLEHAKQNKTKPKKTQYVLVKCYRPKASGSQKALDFGLEINKMACGIAGFCVYYCCVCPPPTFFALPSKLSDLLPTGTNSPNPSVQGKRACVILFS